MQCAWGRAALSGKDCRRECIIIHSHTGSFIHPFQRDSHLQNLAESILTSYYFLRLTHIQAQNVSKAHGDIHKGWTNHCPGSRDKQIVCPDYCNFFFFFNRHLVCIFKVVAPQCHNYSAYLSWPRTWLTVKQFHTR